MDAAEPRDKGPKGVLGPDQICIVGDNPLNQPPRSAAKTAPWATPAATGVVHDLPDGRGTTPALRATAETAVDFSSGPRPGLDVQGRADIEVAQYITGTDNHGARHTDEVLFWHAIDTDPPSSRQRKNAEVTCIPICAGPPQAAAA